MYQIEVIGVRKTMVEWDGQQYITIDDETFDTTLVINAFQDEIRSAKQKADALAAEFRSLFQQSQEAQKNNDLIKARQIATSAREKQAECIQYNEEVRTLRRRLTQTQKLLWSLQRDSSREPLQLIDESHSCIDRKMSAMFINSANKPVTFLPLSYEAGFSGERIPQVQKNQVTINAPSYEASGAGHLLFGVDPDSKHTRLEWAKHIAAISERESSAAVDIQKTAALLTRVLQKPSLKRSLKKNRKAYYDYQTGIVVIADMNAPEQSVLFQPQVELASRTLSGKQYFDTLK